jgi:hypothetical protein
MEGLKYGSGFTHLVSEVSNTHLFKKLWSPKLELQFV